MTELVVQLRHAKRNQATTLDLSQRMLTFMPKQVLIIPTLAFLDLSRNQIQHLPSQISQLIHLHTLILQYNQLKDLPSQLLQLNRLVCLSLKGNPLSSQYQPLLNIKQGDSLWEVLSDCLSYQDAPSSTPSWLSQSNSKPSLSYKPSYQEGVFRERNIASYKHPFKQQRVTLKMSEKQAQEEKQTLLGTLLIQEEELTYIKYVQDRQLCQITEGVYCGLSVHASPPKNHLLESKIQFETTVNILAKYRHPHIVLLIGAIPSKQIIITQALQTSLHKFLSLVKPTDQQKSKIVYELLLAFSHLYRHGILHRNICSQTIFMDKNGSIKISGFDFAIHQTRQIQQQTPQIPSIYVAPELMETGALHTFHSDIFAVGTVLHQIYSEVLSFEGSKGKQILQKYSLPSQLPTKPGLRTQISQILSKCRNVRPEDRPTIEDLLRVQW